MEFNDIEEPWTTKRDEFLQKLNALRGTAGVFLNVPLSNRLHSQINKLMDKGCQACIDEAKNYTNQANSLGAEFNLNIEENAMVVAYKEQLKFFADNNLIEGV